MSRDDLLLETSDVSRQFMSGQLVSIEEKVDGANLGISIASDWSFRVQNRSHFVNASTHAQFRGLDKWLTEHSHELYAVLGEPGQRILFGEFVP